MTLPTRLRVVAHRLLEDEGPEALTVRRLAAAADVAPMSIYNHFGSKDGVVDQLVRDGFEELRDAVVAIPDGDDPLDDIRRAARAYRGLAMRRPHLYALMFERNSEQIELSETSLVMATASFSALVDRVRTAQSAGRIVADDATALADQLWAVVHGLVTLELHGFGFVDDREATFDATVDTVLRGLRPGAVS
jgi:AcrR family transcriptional regulator